MVALSPGPSVNNTVHTRSSRPGLDGISLDYRAHFTVTLTLDTHVPGWSGMQMGTGTESPLPYIGSLSVAFEKGTCEKL